MTAVHVPALRAVIDLAGGPLVADPCPGKTPGPDHDPTPTGYGDHYEYAAQLLHAGWTQHRCPGCGLWARWRPSEPMPQPPMRPNPDDDHGVWELPDDVDERGCAHCEDDAVRPCPALGGVR